MHGSVLRAASVVPCWLGKSTRTFSLAAKRRPIASTSPRKEWSPVACQRDRREIAAAQPSSNRLRKGVEDGCDLRLGVDEWCSRAINLCGTHLPSKTKCPVSCQRRQGLATANFDTGRCCCNQREIRLGQVRGVTQGGAAAALGHDS
jgi:hypothetical protein